MPLLPSKTLVVLTTFLSFILLFPSLTLAWSSSSSPLQSSRRAWISSAIASTLVSSSPQDAHAAPPVAIMMEELGYFPVGKNGKNGVVYVPARVRRDASPQAIELAEFMRQEKISMAGAYWCPHCRRQRELFGRQSQMPYRECAVDGFQATSCKGVTGYPTWVKQEGRKSTVVAVGEMPLSVLAEKLGYPGIIDESLEQNVPPLLGSAACKLPSGGAAP